MSEIDDIIKKSSKAELLEALANHLETMDKVIVVLIEDEEDSSRYKSLVMTLGVDTTYEAYGILDVAKQDLMNEDY